MWWSITNLLIGGIIPAIKARVNAPIAVTLQGDDLFLDGLVEPYRTQVIDQMSKLARQVDGFVTFSDFYANQMSQKLNLDRSKFHLVPLGIEPANSLSSQVPSSNLQLAQARSLTPTIEREHPLVLGTWRASARRRALIYWSMRSSNSLSNQAFLICN